MSAYHRPRDAEYRKIKRPFPPALRHPPPCRAPWLPPRWRLPAAHQRLLRATGSSPSALRRGGRWPYGLRRGDGPPARLRVGHFAACPLHPSRPIEHDGAPMSGRPPRPKGRGLPCRVPLAPLRAREPPGSDWSLGHRARRAQRLSLPAVNDGASRRFVGIEGACGMAQGSYQQARFLEVAVCRSAGAADQSVLSYRRHVGG